MTITIRVAPPRAVKPPARPVPRWVSGRLSFPGSHPRPDVRRLTIVLTDPVPRPRQPLRAQLESMTACDLRKQFAARERAQWGRRKG
jgi:hypothetical protein